MSFWGSDLKHVMQGLLVALQNASPRSLIVVFTDNGSKDLDLEREIVRLRKAKECEVFIVLTPAYEGRLNGPSLPSYGRMGKVAIPQVPFNYLVSHSIITTAMSR